MSSRIEDLSPKAQELYGLFAQKLKEGGVAFVVVSTFRTVEEQQALWFKGRDSNGKVVNPDLVVTQCDGIINKSNHQSRNAFDLTFADEGGHAIYPSDPVRWKSLGEIGKSVGLEWGGDWKPFDGNGLGWDIDHFEVPV